MRTTLMIIAFLLVTMSAEAQKKESKPELRVEAEDSRSTNAYVPPKSIEEGNKILAALRNENGQIKAHLTHSNFDPFS